MAVGLAAVFRWVVEFAADREGESREVKGEQIYSLNWIHQAQSCSDEQLDSVEEEVLDK